MFQPNILIFFSLGVSFHPRILGDGQGEVSYHTAALEKAGTPSLPLGIVPHDYMGVILTVALVPPHLLPGAPVHLAFRFKEAVMSQGWYLNFTQKQQRAEYGKFGTSIPYNCFYGCFGQK